MAEEKVLTVNLIRSSRKMKNNRSGYATRLLKIDIAKRTGAKTVKLGSHINHEIWKRGAKKPPSYVRIKAVVDEGVAKVELLGHEYVDFKPTNVVKKEKLTDKLRAHLSAKEQQNEQLEKAIDGKQESDEKTVEGQLKESITEEAKKVGEEVKKKLEEKKAEKKE